MQSGDGFWNAFWEVQVTTAETRESGAAASRDPTVRAPCDRPSWLWGKKQNLAFGAEFFPPIGNADIDWKAERSTACRTATARTRSRRPPFHLMIGPTSKLNRSGLTALPNGCCWLCAELGQICEARSAAWIKGSCDCVAVSSIASAAHHPTTPSVSALSTPSAHSCQCRRGHAARCALPPRR